MSFRNVIADNGAKLRRNGGKSYQELTPVTTDISSSPVSKLRRNGGKSYSVVTTDISSSVTTDISSSPVSKMRQNGGKNYAPKIIEVVKPELMRIGGKRRGSGVIAWTPASITLLLWLDASVNSSVALDGSGKVSQWSDLSSYDRHATQSMSSRRPSYSTQINGLNVISFSGSDIHLICAPAWGIFWELFLVYKHDVTNDEIQVPFRDDATGASSAIVGYPSSSTSFYRVRSTVNASYSTSIANEFGTDLNIVNISSNVNNQATATVNGVSKTTWNVSGVMGNNLYIGTNGPYLTLGLKGSIAEFLILPTPATVLNRKKIEGYLAHKWGITGSLPVDHPYKNSTPTL